MTRYTKNHPFFTFIKKRFLLSKRGIEKRTFHFILDIKNADLSFSPGDSAAIFPINNSQYIEKIISFLQAKKEDMIINPRSKKKYTLKEFLSSQANISRLSPSIIKLAAIYQKQKEKKEMLNTLLLPENKEKLKEYILNHELWDFLQEQQGIKIPPQELCDKLFPLLPRLYSICSSQNMFPEEMHLLITAVTYKTSQNVLRYGVATHFLCDIAKENTTKISLFIHSPPNFFLPPDDNASIIMIGPGTGIAPFRSFLQERLFRQAKGKNWLFFGDRYRNSDFYYGDFFNELEKKKFLRLDTAFSRDQENKIYVQHKMLEKASDIWKWIQEGAYIYVCGNAQRMAKDVDKTLETILRKEGHMSMEKAKEYIKTLRKEKRYLKDIY